MKNKQESNNICDIFSDEFVEICNNYFGGRPNKTI